MSRKHVDPLEVHEQALIDSIEADEWIPVKDKAEYITEAKKYAEATIRKDKRMNIRISERDMRNLKIVALEDGIPYQTLVSMILHKYLNSRLGNEENNRGISS